MSTTVKPPAGRGKVNRIGLPVADYKGGDSTLCAGCGHDAITSQIIRAFWEYGVEPHRLAKLSGIGCSSKTPAYFLNQSHGLNAVHGRMPAIGTGAVLGNRDLLAIGVSGDGDSVSIGLGQFCHLLRRNVPDDLHRGEQRRIRPDEGPVFGDGRLRVQIQSRRSERPAGHRYLCYGDRIGL